MELTEPRRHQTVSHVLAWLLLSSKSLSLWMKSWLQERSHRTLHPQSDIFGRKASLRRTSFDGFCKKAVSAINEL